MTNKMSRRCVLPFKYKTFWLLTFIITQWTVGVLAQTRYLCNDNIVIMADNIQEPNRCNQVSTAPTTWDKAWEYCHSRNGWMVDCPSCSEGQGAYIGEELLAYNGVSSIWSGLHISSHRLLKDNFPTIESLGKLKEGWNTTKALEGGMCVIEEYQELDCGKDSTTPAPAEVEDPVSEPPKTETDVTQEPQKRRKRRSSSGLSRARRSALPSEIPENCLPVYKQRIVPCDERHMFACYFTGIPSFFFMESVGFQDDIVLFGKNTLDRRFFLTKVKATLDNSDAMCDKTVKGARTLRSKSEASHRVIMTALSDAVKTRTALQRMGISLEDLKRTLYWYREGGDGEEEEERERLQRETGVGAGVRQEGQSYHDAADCMAALLSFSYSGSVEGEGEGDDQGDNFATMTWPCTASLPLLCEIPVEHKETPAPEIQVLPDLDFKNAIRIVNNEVFVPSRIFQFNPLNMVCIIPPGFSEFQSITVYKNNEPVQVVDYNVELDSDRIRIQTDIVENPLLYFNLYHCQVNDKVNNKLINSNQMFVRITEWEIYTLHIAVNQSPQYTALWNEVYQMSLAGALANYTRDNLPNIGSESQLKSNVFIRIINALGPATELWQLEALYFIPQPTPRLVYYIASFNPVELNEQPEGIDQPDFLENPELDFQQGPPATGEKRVEQVRDFMRRAFLQEADMLPELKLADIRVYSIDKCWPKNISVESLGREYAMPETDGGAVWESPQTCAQDGGPLVTVECEGTKRTGFDWGEVRVNPLCDYQSDVSQDSEITEDLKTVSQENVTKENVDEILEKTEELTDQISDKDLQPIDVTLIADILQKSSEVDDLTSEQANKILATATRINRLEEGKLEEAQKIGKAASRVIQSVDDLGNNLQVPDSSKYSRLVTDNLALEVWDLAEDYDKNTIVGLKVLSDGNGEAINVNDLISLFSPSGLDYGEAEAAILLPREFIERQLGKNSKNISVRLAMNVYADTGLYQATNGLKGNVSLNSKVIAAKILVNEVPITDLGPYNVTTVFLPKVKVPLKDRTRFSVCAWWDFDANRGDGGWSSRGCVYDRTESGRDVCVCDHLTNFAILVSFYDQDEMDEDHDLALGVISIVGLVLSIIGLSISIISFLCIKKLRQGRPQQTLFNLSIALLLSWVVFLAGIGRTENHAGCIAVAAILHYLIMASFMWMLMEGILQYLLFVKVMNTYFTNYMVKTAVPAWGLPIIPVVIVLAIDPELYRGGENYCWMSLDAFYYAFAIPVGAIILTNLAIFAKVVHSLCTRKDMSKHSSQSSSQTIVNFRASFICFFILGLSWIFGFLTIEDARTVFQYIFCITASLQGFVIFLMMTARDKTVRGFWKSICCRCMSDSQKQKTYRTWGEKGTGSSSNSGVPSVTRTNKTYLDTSRGTASQTSLSVSEQAPPTLGDVPLGVKRKGENELDNIQIAVQEEDETNSMVEH